MSESAETASIATIRLIVGHSKTEFDIPEALLCTHCPFFLNAISGNFLESETRTFTFPDDEPQQFDDLCAWLYNDDSQPFIPTQSWLWLAKLWMFADKYHIDEFQNTIIDAIYLKFAGHEEGINISFETLDYIAENTYPSSPLRSIFADMLTNGISLQQMPSRLENIPPEFLQDMCLALKRIISRNAPTNVSLLTNPISTYYTTHSSSCKANAMPKPHDDVSTGIYCQGPDCEQQDPQEPIRGGIMHICTNHNMALCNDCRYHHQGHRRKMMSFLTAPYSDNVTGPQSTIIDGQINDGGFHCDGPKCDPCKRSHDRLPHTVMNGDRYHCLQCSNVDYCSLCIRGELDCKEDGHQFLRIRPTFAKATPVNESISIKLRQERAAAGVCWRCASAEHETEECEEVIELSVADDVEVED